MNKTITREFRDQDTRDEYVIRFEWTPPGRFLFWETEPGLYRMFVEKRPDCEFELGSAAHLWPQDEICVRVRPQTRDRAKAIALLWMHGFSTYCRTGVFPNGGARINVGDN